MTQRIRRWLRGAACLLALPLAAFAQQQHAHVHGQIKLDIAIDGPTITIAMESPLDNIVGFERAPRGDVEKNTVEQAVARLRAADQLFKIDEAASCKLGPVELSAPVIGLGKAGADGGKEGHADLDATFSFNCIAAAKAGYIDVDLFNAFRNARQVDAQIVTPRGQFKRSLKRPNVRLSWTQ